MSEEKGRAKMKTKWEDDNNVDRETNLKAKNVDNQPSAPSEGPLVPPYNVDESDEWWTLSQVEQENCPYLETINRKVLHFDSEKYCSVSFSKINVYACLVCGKYYQGKLINTHAYSHKPGKIYCLPDGYEINDPSLDDIRQRLNPRFAISHLIVIDSTCPFLSLFILHPPISSLCPRTTGYPGYNKTKGSNKGLKLSAWKQGTLTQAGREILIKAVTSAIPLYTMQVFKLPKKLCEEINSAVASFWWGQQSDEGRIHWISWKNLAEPKLRGGKVELKNGVDIQELQNLPQKVQDLMDKQEGRWKLEDVQQAVTEETILAIENMPICEEGGPDRLVWPASKNGEYTVKTGYYLLKAQEERQETNQPFSSHHISDQIWKAIWPWKVPRKIRYFCWKLCRGALATQFTLWRRKIACTPICPLCHSEMETPEHVVLLCKWVNLVWFGTDLGHIVDKNSISSVDKWLENSVYNAADNGIQRERVEIIVGYTLWNIWKERCSTVFEKREPCPEIVIRRIRNGVTESQGILDSIQKATAINKKEPQQWERPEDNWCKANCDAAFCKESGYAGIGIIIRNSDAEVVGGLAERHKVCSSLIAEGIAVKNGLQLAKQMRIPKIVVETNSQVLVQSVERSDDGHWEIDNIVHDIRSLMKYFEDCRIRWIARSANKAADWLSQQLKKGMRISNWVNVPPSTFVHVLSRDGLPAPPL
ncbi:hypothetical protein CCACVL1_23137 [Corchorus capsularis]|uniref:RNase H type-1 domain-containing protein n=1 Tax=Corchorus capsularis TaxID=210143 RepID=A0A1R3GV69_COCAP|nr:hypothetical protein CCACVL1_23137 [Corchorus capsularis]